MKAYRDMDGDSGIRNQQGIDTPMRVNNAGLVILQSFIPALFSRLGLIDNHRFVTDSAQCRAVHYLQFLVTGCLETPEHDLILNKLLCGLELDAPVESGIEISAVEMEVCQSLLNSVIGYWSAIGSSSIDGFRGNWLVREGALTHAKDRWELIVDRRAYDVLLARAPFSYSVIKMPWMEKAIYVTWPA
ncbi:MAG: contractile injection system tape measure protein [Sideroxydans sp.]|nr:contractile injection system tape measure protein [Sideroxydans sp.]